VEEIMAALRTCFAILLFTVLAGCDGDDPPPAPEVTAVAPSAGTILGGTTVTITGTTFLDGATVTVGGVDATNVVVVNDTTITCTTPPGTSPGPKDVAVTTTSGTDTAPNAFAYFPPPSLTAVDIDRGATTGGLTITLTGTGFSDNAAGTNSVTVGGAAATSVTTVNDTTITCVTPTGTGGERDIVVSNANGMSTLVGGFNYVQPILYAATARTSASSQPGTFYSVDPATGSGTMIGATGDVLTGLAFDPTFTTLYGLNTAPFSNQSLFTVDLTTGGTTLVGATGDPPTNNCGDLTFVGTTLVGNSWNGEFCSFDLATGAGTLIGNNASTTQGLAIAADAGQQLWLCFGPNPGELYTVDPTTGAVTEVATLSGDIGGDTICAMTFLDGVLYGVTAGDQSGTPAARLVTINTTTAAVTFVGNLPDNIDALEGNIR
jgi:hypothetical protein